MSRRANPVTIGIFVSGAFALLAGVVIFFGTAQFYEKTEKFILFFDESVNGLSVGSSVKFKGVPIGKVTRIMIRAENQPLASSAIPVIIELDESRLERELNVGMKISDREAFAKEIARGLRARLNTESFITGLLFIEIDYVSDPGDPVLVQETLQYKEIPTVPSTVQAVTQQALQAIATLSESDMGGTIKTVQDTIRLARTRLEELDVPRMVNSFTETSDSVRHFMDSTDVSETMNKLDRALDQFSAALETVESESGVIREDLDEALSQIKQFFKQATTTMEELEGVVGDDSRVVYELERTLMSVSEAAEAMRRLADFVERNPKAFLTGRSGEESGN